MQNDISRFFRPVNRSLAVAEEDYTQVKAFVSMADAMARSTYCSLYIIDYNRFCLSLSFSSEPALLSFSCSTSLVPVV